MRPRAEQSHVICQPLSHSLRTQVPIQRRPTIQIIVLGARCELRREIGKILGGFVQGQNGVGDVESAVTSAIGRGAEEKLATLAVGSGEGWESAVDDNDGVNATVAPIGRILWPGVERELTGGGGVSRGIDRWGCRRCGEAWKRDRRRRRCWGRLGKRTLK
ncbi:UNVERIFIED_CONTAM: hypothetical protein Sangu_0843900 [Sesamum angustifolium]|uniref:Uncharacterized protein n=1 Tax=Sesamum angustifolium TaxID=2727405 RepID=A0AAW2PD30_9LAMI